MGSHEEQNQPITERELGLIELKSWEASQLLMNTSFESQREVLLDKSGKELCP